MFNRSRWVTSDALSLSCWVHPGSLGSFGFALGVVGFIRGHWVDEGAPWGSFSSFGLVVFTRVRPGGRWVHSVSLDSLGFALGVSLGSCGVVRFTTVRPEGRSVHRRS